MSTVRSSTTSAPAIGPGEARPAGRRGALERPLEGELDRGRVEGRAVVELDVGPQLEAHLRRGHDLVAGGQPRLDRHLLVEVDERLQDVVVDPRAGGGGLGVRVERHRIGRPDDRERPAALLRVGRRREGDQPHRENARQDGSDPEREPPASTHRHVSFSSRPARLAPAVVWTASSDGLRPVAACGGSRRSRVLATDRRHRSPRPPPRGRALPGCAPGRARPLRSGARRTTDRGPDSSRARWSPARGGTGIARSWWKRSPVV